LISVKPFIRPGSFKQFTATGKWAETRYHGLYSRNEIGSYVAVYRQNMAAVLALNGG